MPGGLCGEEEKQGLLCLRSAKPRPAPSQHSALAIVTAASRSFFSPREHISPLKTHIPPSSCLPLGKASPRHRVQSGILPRESGGKQLYGDHVVWRSRL